MCSYNKAAVRNLLKFLEKVYGAVAEIEEDEGRIKYLYLQESYMKDIFNFYNQRICIDCTYLNFEIDMYMFTILCEDSNGRIHVIALIFSQTNDLESLSWLIDMFKRHNPNWKKIKTVSVDPGIKPWQKVKDLLLQPLITITFYHLFTMFKNGVSDLQVISDHEKLRVFDLFKNLYYAPTQSDFLICYEQYLESSEINVPDILINYLLENWFNKQQEWRIPLDFNNENIFQNLNVFLEDFNEAILSLFSVERNTIEFIKKVFIIILLKKNEKPAMFLQPMSFLYSRFSPEYQISRAFTPYAAKFVIQQLDLSSEITTDSTIVADTYVFNNFGVSISTTSTECTCHFYLLTALPCRHIFAVRRFSYLCAFTHALVDFAWSMNYYQTTLTCMVGYFHQNTDNRIPQDITSRTALSAHLFEISVPQLLELPKEKYKARLGMLKSLAEAWKNNEDISLHFAGIEKTVEEKKQIWDPAVPGPSSATNYLEAVPYKDQDLSNIQELEQPVVRSKLRGLNEHNFLDLSSLPEDLGNDFDSVEKETKVKSFKASILRSKYVNLAYICVIITKTKESCFKWLRKMQLIPSSMKCMSCGSEMITRSLSRLADGFVWSCPKTGESRRCSAKRSSIRLSSWFEMTNITLEHILLFTYMWINKFTQTQILVELGISSSNYVMLDKFFQRVCEESLTTPVEEQVATSNYTTFQDQWLRMHEGEDRFIEFLKEVARIYNSDIERRASTSSD